MAYKMENESVQIVENSDNEIDWMEPQLSKLNPNLDSTLCLVNVNTEEELQIVNNEDLSVLSAEKIIDECYSKIVLNVVQNDDEQYSNESQGMHSEDSFEIKRNISFSEQDFICFKKYISEEILDMKKEIKKNSNLKQNYEKEFLEKNNLKLKTEVSELREMVSKLVEKILDEKSYKNEKILNGKCLNLNRRNQSSMTNQDNFNTNKNLIEVQSKNDEEREKWLIPTHTFATVNYTNNGTEKIKVKNKYSSLYIEDNNKINDENNYTDSIITSNTQNHSQITQRRRKPDFITTKHPENQHDFKTHYPANSTNNIKILCDSIPKRINIREFNRCTRIAKVGRTHIKSSPGANTRRLKHYSIPTLEEENPESVIIHV